MSETDTVDAPEPTDGEPRFRFATSTDVAAIVALVDSAYRGDASRVGWTTEADLLEGQRTDVDAVAELIQVPGSHMLLVSVGGDLVACCNLARQGPDTTYLGMFAVRPGVQGRGLGGAVLTEADRLAREWGTTRIRMTVLSARRDLLAWYVRMGFELTGETEPFPYGDERFGIPTRPDLEFLVLVRAVP
jgi:GNAT superfamily N-acetyltransferase